MHPTLSTQLAAEHRRCLEEVAAARRTRRHPEMASLRTRAGLLLVRAGLRMSTTLTARMIAVPPPTCSPASTSEAVCR